MKTISILIPALNEEQSLPLLVERINAQLNRLSQYQFTVLVVDDGSTDQTPVLLEELHQQDNRWQYVCLSRNFGKEIAMLAGFDYLDSDAVIVMDADLQDPPELIETMIHHWEEGYEDVYAKRISRKGESWLKKTTSTYFYRVLQKMTAVNIQVDTGDFRLLDRKCVEALKQMRESQRYTKGMFSWIGFRKKEVLFEREPRVAGKTKWNYGKLWNLAIEGITSFTTLPLRFATWIGLGIASLSFLYLLIVVGRTLLFGSDVAGYPSLIAIILFLGGVQLLFLGILGEYIGRIFNETKRRPLYFVEKTSIRKE